MQVIIPHLWYDKEALEAAKWYVDLFEDSCIIHTTTLRDTPSGDAELVDFKLAGIRFEAISAGPYYKFNPSVSLMVVLSESKEVDRLYHQLSEGGTELMPLGEYPFSKRYVWLQDKYGLSWQLMYEENAKEHQKIRPVILFSGEVCGRAEAAIHYYASVFKDAEINVINHYAKGEATDVRAKLNYAEVNIKGMQMIAMDHSMGGEFTFNEAVSFLVICENQQEIDYYFKKLSFVPEAEQCGWVKDQYGLSWQISAAVIDDVFLHGTEEEIRRVTQALLNMDKPNLAAILEARQSKA